ncbi:MAG: hypothetical protein WC483_05490 [Candidatus Paceibacterota bacterium]
MTWRPPSFQRAITTSESAPTNCRQAARIFLLAITLRSYGTMLY